ncbi:protein of unknown function DUF996 [Thermodesulfobium narugense DSM 14796]|uniref:DUF996 domain-containing protein n=1 Tax=Thermodesulfobium narugense DSM 14796 TaxID=747365 RepID=M1E7G6_9BACT|nr:DUF996 domain-containing protein [Thermodesulfobium narugense]AEE14638.1 protein of unknown function DUF996 [Thermodesulfobium narugense DSM 14796]
MLNITKEKILGGVGSILIAFSLIPGIGHLSFILGVIMFIISIYSISKLLKESDIYSNIIKSFLISIIGIVISLFLGLYTFASVFSGHWYFGTNILLSFIIFYSFIIASAVFFRKGLIMIASLTDNELFKTSGDVMFWSTVLTIFVIGFIGIFISWILLAIAFFTLPDLMKTSKAENSQFDSDYLKFN